jgi:MoxR-like ATPase
MSANADGQAATEAPADRTSPPVPSVPTTVHDGVPDSLPRKEMTVYRDTEMVIRIRPTVSGADELCLTMYMHATSETDSLTPARTSYWDDEEFDASPNTVTALPDALYDRYVDTVETITERLDLSVVHPISGHGVCHRRHDSLGKHGVVSFRTRFG